MRVQSIMKGWDGLLGAVDFEGEGRGEKKPEKRKREDNLTPTDLNSFGCIYGL